MPTANWTKALRQGPAPPPGTWTRSAERFPQDQNRFFHEPHNPALDPGTPGGAVIDDGSKAARAESGLELPGWQDL